MEKYYKIADLVVAMDTFGRTEQQAIPYLTDDNQEPAFTVMSYADVMKQRNPGISEDNAEYMGTSGGFYKELLKYDGFQFHSSAVVVNGKAYLFSANSGTGKSTHTSLWLKLFGEKAFILNDDKPALRKKDGIWYAYGTPWSGKHDISVNTSVPVAGICMIERGEINEITPFTGKTAIFEVYAQTNMPKSAENRILLLELLDDLIQNVPIWKLRCNMDQEAAKVSYEAMSGKRLENYDE